MRIVLDITTSDPLVGSAAVDGDDERPFAGWLELLSLLDRLVTSDPSAPAAPELCGELGAVADAELGEDV